ncbi:multidrug efflux RND transporter permease subunit [Mucilaginibacter rubeus]|uniref:Multidrug efflux RND transporter permease subunit n=1 Tax=Mucilaginibacter rubeus TaxID=2027860 RepID=A0AAE6JCI5_9SPHI|nr:MULTISPECIES: multidrug efflux RND transporter permease subunit [Mucilaginibacter]QEM02828.1 multidrug efflux RND transporter permease subunit [Mucilaginibacter rubeus]QEM15446.1 multidrug efflux RND transporter permease subunit [Mucilaginibacter gossypii]QTE41824.1 multidrug efflux RND transporter permease subunit [Mucilaginibacter rubeus]QTE48428.1 multidrug efflux RND transporter permease subunit [Mucilaginibacter rubeus]QTE59815.1 multidrug efflux RND transporter permease subunit [Mucil
MIADTFIKRPVTAIVISLVILIVGILSISSLPIGQYPDITPPTVSVSGNYVGADALTVEQTVATPVEVQVNGVPGMTYLQSNSSSNGQMSMTVNFDVGTDINIAALDVQNRVGIALPTLPQEVQRLGMVVRKRNPSILMLVAMFSPKGTHDVTFTDNYTNVFIKDAILRTKGVGDVVTRADDFSMRIWLNPDKLAALGMSAADVTSALQEQNAQVAAGTVGATPQLKGQTFEYSVIVKGRLEKPEEFGNVVVKTQPNNGGIVHLKDVARIELGKFNYSGNSFVDGKRASYLLVYQAPNSNSLETADNVYATMNELKKSFPKDIDYVVPFEAITVVKVSVSEVIETLVIALVLVIIVVFLFLQSWRTTLIPVLAIPVSIIGTFIFFIPLNFTINTLTLFGFVLAIGIVVDDAIVVVEAVQHYMDEEGMTPKEATQHAMADISAPVIAIALILAAVFVPVGFVPGIVGRLYQQFAITIAISVLISAFVALSLTPALCTLILRPHKIDESSRGLNKFFFKFNTWFTRVTGKYRNTVDKSIKNSRYIIILLVCIIVGTILLFRSKPSGFIPLEDDGRVYITFDLPEASATGRTVDVLHNMMRTLDSVPEIAHYAALGGLNAISFASKSNSATIFVQLKPWDERKEKSQQITALVARLNQKLGKYKEANVVVIQPPAIPGLGSTGGFSFILEEKQAGGDIKVFEKTLRTFLGAINQRKEIARAFSFFTASTPAYQLTIDREKSKKLGVAISDVNNALQTYLGSTYINDFTIYGRNFRVVAQADTSYRTNVQNIGQYFVRNSSGAMVPLSTLTSYKVIENSPLISHYNLFRSAEINGSTKPGYSSGDAITALKETAAQVLPQGYGYEFSGLSREELLSGSKTVYIFALSIGFVFLFLAALYESWSVPFSVLLSVPLGAFGAILFLTFWPDLTNNVYAQIGLITLIGLAAKNAILIVEFAKERVDTGMELEKATLEAVRLRLRPIIMTSMAFILGVGPLMVASGAGAEARKTIGWTVFGGMLTATSLAIFIVPVLFYLITKMAYGKEKLAELEKNYDPKKHGPEV